MTETRKLRVFLCHSSQDKPIVRELYQRLNAEGWIDPWLDEEKLLPGQDWDLEIEKAVEAADAVIVCLSNNSVSKEGSVQKEIKRALDKAEEKLEDAIFIIPLRFENCLVPRRLKVYQYQDYFKNIELAYKRLHISLNKRANALGIDVLGIKDKLLQQAKESARREKEEKIRKEVEDKILLEEEAILRKRAEERVRKRISKMLFVQAEEKYRLELEKVEKHNHKKIVSKKSREKTTSKSDNRIKSITSNATKKDVQSPPKENMALVSTNSILIQKLDHSEIAIRDSLKDYQLYNFGGVDFVKIPAGEFIMGSNNAHKVRYESPKHKVLIPYDYFVACRPITNEQYNDYVLKMVIDHPVEDWIQKKDHPVTWISWQDAVSYCRWFNTIILNQLDQNMVLRLPTEAEWEKAARGPDGRVYPWGDKFMPLFCNTSEGAILHTTPVGAYSPNGDSYYGVQDMVGNVWEWTVNIWGEKIFMDSPSYLYPYNSQDGRENLDAVGVNARINRGGSFYYDAEIARCSNRRSSYATSKNGDLGFRIVIAPPLMKFFVKAG